MTNKQHSGHMPSNRTNPEISADQDALNLARRSSGISKNNLKGRFHLTMPIKIGAVALIFAGIVLSVWIMKTPSNVISDEDLPVISTNFENDDFKVAPNDEDNISTPHSDKEFYNELGPKTAQNERTQFRSEAENPSKQVSQEALFAEVDRDAIDDKVVKETTLEKSENNVDVNVVENASDTKQNYKAPTPTTGAKPRKTLEMAVRKPIYRKSRTQKSAPVLVKKQSTKTVNNAITARSYWIQIASLPTQATAQKEWKRLQTKAPKFLKGQNYKTVRVDLGKPKGIRYRVHFGPFNRAKAIQKCKNLKNNTKIGCLVMKGK